VYTHRLYNKQETAKIVLKSKGALCRWDILLTKIIRVRRIQAGTRVINIRKSGMEVRSEDRAEGNEAASI